jgi:hypothetical protein
MRTTNKREILLANVMHPLPPPARIKLPEVY